MTAYDPFTDFEAADREQRFDELRRTCPVSEIEPDTFYLARHADVVEVSRDVDRFGQGPFRPKAPPRAEEERGLGEMDPPLHTARRRVFQRHLGPRAVRTHEPFVTAACHELLDRVADRGRADIVEDLASPLTVKAVAHVAGLPDELLDEMLEYVDAVASLRTAQPDGVAARAAATIQSFRGRLAEVIDQRAGDRRDNDLITDLLDERDPDGEPLTPRRVLNHVANDLCIGGTETTRHLIGNLVHDLLAHEDAWQQLGEDPELVAVAVEESLRFRPIVQVLFRRAKQDTSIAGVDVPAGSLLGLGYPSANHDPGEWREPESFRLDRGAEVRGHLGFGFGPHACVGAALARLEATTAITVLRNRHPDLRLASPQRYERVVDYMMQGPRRVAVELGRPWST